MIPVLYVTVGKETADSAIRFLNETGLLDKSMKIIKSAHSVNIPILGQPSEPEMSHLLGLGCKISTGGRFQPRRRVPPPFNEIRKDVQNTLGNEIASTLPDKWEMFGDILVIRLPGIPDEHKTAVARAYARYLNAKTVLEDVGGISGIKREPLVRTLYGTDTLTVHRENRVLFMFDTSRIMFSSGNIEERRRMATISNSGETVVDMFAGIGYFSIPMAVHSKPKKIISCEINSVAYEYLKRNIELNRVPNLVEPRLGDCMDTAPEGMADRVVMGYLHSETFIPKAMRVVKPGGIIHYHNACPIDAYERPINIVRKCAADAGRDVEQIKFTIVKSYAPCINHVVLDMRIV